MAQGWYQATQERKRGTRLNGAVRLECHIKSSHTDEMLWWILNCRWRKERHTQLLISATKKKFILFSNILSFLRISTICSLPCIVTNSFQIQQLTTVLLYCCWICRTIKLFTSSLYYLGLFPIWKFVLNPSIAKSNNLWGCLQRFCFPICFINQSFQPSISPYLKCYPKHNFSADAVITWLIRGKS